MGYTNSKITNKLNLPNKFQGRCTPMYTAQPILINKFIRSINTNQSLEVHPPPFSITSPSYNDFICSSELC